jgi:hypothetical protein
MPSGRDCPVVNNTHKASCYITLGHHPLLEKHPTSRACSRISDDEEGGDQMNRRQESFAQFVVARRDPAELFELTEKSFNPIAPGVALLVVRWFVCAIFFGGDHGLDAISGQALADAVCIVGFIERRLLQGGMRIEALVKRFELLAIMILARRQLERDTAVFIDRGRVDLGRKSPARPSQSLVAAFFFGAPARVDARGSWSSPRRVRALERRVHSAGLSTAAPRRPASSSGDISCRPRASNPTPQADLARESPCDSNRARLRETLVRSSSVGHPPANAWRSQWPVAVSPTSNRQSVGAALRWSSPASSRNPPESTLIIREHALVSPRSPPTTHLSPNPSTPALHPHLYRPENTRRNHAEALWRRRAPKVGTKKTLG